MKDFACYLISTYDEKNLSFLNERCVIALFWSEISCLLLEQGKCLMDCVLWQDECEITYGEFLKKSTHEDVMNLTMKKFKTNMDVKVEVLSV